MAAERDSTDRYVAAFMEDRVGQTFDARVTGVTRFGLFVRLADTGAEGLIPIRNLGTDYFHHDEKRQALVGQRSHVAYGMGNVLTVKLMEAAPLTGGLRFALEGAETVGDAGRPRLRQARETSRSQGQKTRIQGQKNADFPDNGPQDRSGP